MVKVFKMSPENTDSSGYMDFDGMDFIIDGNQDYTSFNTDKFTMVWVYSVISSNDAHMETKDLYEVRS